MSETEIRVGDIVTCQCDPRKHLLVTNTEGDYKIRAYSVGARMAKEEDHPRNQITVVFPTKLGFHDDPPTFEEMDALRKRIAELEAWQRKALEPSLVIESPGEEPTTTPYSIYQDRLTELEKQVRAMTDAITSLESQQQANRAQMDQHGRRLNDTRDTFGKIRKALG